MKEKAIANPIGFENLNQGKRSYSDYLIEAYGPSKAHQMTMTQADRNRLNALRKKYIDFNSNP